MRIRLLRTLPLFFSVAVFAVGALTLFAWMEHLPSLLKWGESLVPLQFNTALCLLTGALGIALLQTRYRRFASVPAFVAFSIGAVTFSQYLFNVNLGIDEFFVKFYLDTAPLYPGRIAANSSLCFALLGAGIFFLSAQKEKKNFQLPIYFGVSIVFFSVLALIGLLVKLPVQYAWGNFSSMSLQSAMGLALLGTSLILGSGRIGSEQKRSLKDFAPVLVSLTVLSGIFLLWEASLWNEAREIRHTTVSKSESIQAQLLQGLEDRVQSVERMASRLSFKDAPSKAAWQADAEMYTQHLGVIEGFGMIKPDYHLKWVHPEKLLGKFINLDLSKDQSRRPTIDLAARTHFPQITPVIELRQGGRGFVLYVPLYDGEKHLGTLSASMRPATFIRHVVQSPGYDVTILAENEILYKNRDDEDRSSNAFWMIETDIDLRGHIWTMQLTPTMETIRSSQSTIPYVILLAGVLSALILAILAQLSITARKQSLIIGEQKSYVDSVINSSPLPIIVIGTDHCVQMWNPASERIFGWKSSEVLGKPLPFVPEELRPMSSALIEKILNCDEMVEAETIRLTKDGRVIPVKISAHALGSDKNNHHGLMAVIDDLTVRKKAEQEIKDAHVIAEKATQIKSEFLANMSHEIRTPLNGIIGMADLMLITPLSDDQKRYAKIIQNSGSSLLTLINDILDFSKIEAGKIQLEEIDFSLASLIEAQADLLIAKARKKTLVLSTYISPNLPAIVKGDSGRIGQVILNLVGNAIKFTDAGSVSVTAVEMKRISSESGPVRVRFEVKDTGIGLSEESCAKLFLPFSQVDGSTARKYGGTGLGLSISKNIVEAMGGTIGIESAEGKGSTFWFELELNRIQNPKASSLSRRVLVIDEDIVSSETILRYLTAWRMPGRITHEVSEAVTILKEALKAGSPYDVVLVGSQSDEFVKAYGENPPKTILLSEFESQALRNYDNILISGRITKPIKQSELYDSLVKLEMREAVQGETEKTPTPITSKKRFSGMRVLVADDVAANQLLTVKFLEYLGYQAQAVGNGLEALDQLQRTHFDVVLMDCQMPEMDGFEATKKIRALSDKRLATIPIIALTANAMGGDDQKCFDAGMDDYLSKPFKKERLDEILSKWLAKKAS